MSKGRPKKTLLGTRHREETKEAYVEHVSSTLSGRATSRLHRVVLPSSPEKDTASPRATSDDVDSTPLEGYVHYIEAPTKNKRYTAAVSFFWVIYSILRTEHIENDIRMNP
jgi:hypothetical protein